MEFPEPKKLQGKIIETKEFAGVRYLRRLIVCGKTACKSCPHGPYWYAQFKSKHGWKEIYIGKKLMSLTEKFEEIRARRLDEKERKEILQQNVKIHIPEARLLP